MEKTFLVAQSIQLVAHTRPVACYPTIVTTVAAIPSEESLQLRVKKVHSPRRKANPAPFGMHRCHKGVLLKSVRRCVIAKSGLLHARPV